MKRFIVFTCIIAIALSILGCGKEESEQLTKAAPYELKEENGKFYLHFSEEYLKSIKPNNTSPNISAQMGANVPQFSSVADLKNAIKTGIFTEKNLTALTEKAKSGILEIPDPNSLYEAVLPSTLGTGVVSLHSIMYDIDINWSDNNNYVWGCIFIDSEGDFYNDRFNYYIINLTDKADTIISDRIIEDRNAREIIYTNHTGKYKALLYQTEKSDETLYVLETYCLDYYYPSLAPSYLSEAIPLHTDIFGKGDDVSWYATFTGFEERPSIEWLTSFGVKKLAE